jgi:hypothetical protein
VLEVGNHQPGGGKHIRSHRSGPQEPLDAVKKRQDKEEIGKIPTGQTFMQSRMGTTLAGWTPECRQIRSERYENSAQGQGAKDKRYGLAIFSIQTERYASEQKQMHHVVHYDIEFPAEV